ncbi:MAG TPA: hypothetical protein VFI22_01960 [Thermomicrobiales bacterium]|nr:hypothetical protein [Thermomicrobiales bacterium]
MGVREWLLLAVVVIVPLAIAAAVTLWSLEQARYRPKAKGTVRTSSGVSRRQRRPADPAASDAGGAAMDGQVRDEARQQT